MTHLIQKDWEKEFDKKFPKNLWAPELQTIKDVKSFIHSLLSSHTSEILGEIVENLEKEKDTKEYAKEKELHFCRHYYHRAKIEAKGHNQALDLAIKKIKEKI